MIEKALEKYYQHFGENYPLMIVGNMTDNEIIERINSCIENGEPEKEPEYEENADY